MSLFESIYKSSDSATDLGKQYATKSLDYYKLKTFKITAKSLSLITKVMLIGSVALLAIIFLGISLAIFMGDYFENISLGFLSVGLLFFCIALVIFLLGKQIDHKIIRNVGHKFYKS